MTRAKLVLLALAPLLALSPAAAALKVGDQAPDFTTQAALGEQVSAFTLSANLKQGPVVLYFYPKAFTPGCTAEAHAFAARMDEFKALGAQVIGVSHDDLDQLKRFGTSECQSKFAVATDPDQKIMKAYDAVWAERPGLASRTSYVIAPDGKILESYTDLKPDQHVTLALNALKAWKAMQN
jgi:peroxiredoxin